MSNSKWNDLKNLFFSALARALPETVKRFILYELNDRHNLKLPENKRDFWGVTTEQLYDTIRD